MNFKERLLSGLPIKSKGVMYLWYFINCIKQVFLVNNIKITPQKSLPTLMSTRTHSSRNTTPSWRRMRLSSRRKPSVQTHTKPFHPFTRHCQRMRIAWARNCARRRAPCSYKSAAGSCSTTTSWRFCGRCWSLITRCPLSIRTSLSATMTTERCASWPDQSAGIFWKS